MESKRDSKQPDLKSISPNRKNKGTVPSADEVPVSNIELTTMPNAASPSITTTPDMIMIMKAKNIGAPVRNTATRSVIPIIKISHHSIV